MYMLTDRRFAKLFYSLILVMANFEILLDIIPR